MCKFRHSNCNFPSGKTLPLWFNLFRTCQAWIRDVSTIPQLHIQQVRFQEFRDLQSSKILLDIRLKWQDWNLTKLWKCEEKWGCSQAFMIFYAYVYSIVYISLRHLIAVSSQGLRASCCHCCKRRPGIMTKLLLAVPYGPSREGLANWENDWSEFKCTVPDVLPFWPCSIPWTCQFASVRSHQCQRHSCLSLNTSRGCEVLLLFVSHDKETRWNKDINRQDCTCIQVWYWTLR